MTLRALNNTILFQFVTETSGSQGRFSDRTSSGIFIARTSDSTQKIARWGKVTHIGPDVVGINVGEFVYIEPLMWSFGTEVDGVKLWKTDDTKVIAVTSDESETKDL